MAADGKVSFIPIAILINGKFWDASAYKADPVPMALEPGTVYEGERSGNSLGLFTVGTALHSNANNAQIPWIGTGTWHPVGEEPPQKAMKADITPVGADNVDAPPRLTHDPNAAQKSPPPNVSPSGGTSSSSNPPPAKPSSNGDEPPRLSKPSQPSTPPSDASQAPASLPAPTSPSTPSGDAKSKDSKPSDRANIPASDSSTNEANRPKLRRGKPAQSFVDDEVPGYSKPGSSSTAPKPAGKIPDALAVSSNVQWIPAISDAAGPEPRSYTFEWLKDEEGDRRKQMMDLAKEQLRLYVTAQAKAKIVPAPVHSQPAAKIVKPVEPIFEDVKMVAYDLWNSNQAIIVFSATAHIPPPPTNAAHSEVDSELQYSILLVAYPDIYNNLHKLYSGVTDKFHLDVTPRLELVDAVDADGDGRGELLFRETSDGGSGWVIYRATNDKLYKMFDSSSPE